MAKKQLVNYAKLHQEFFYPGLGQFPATLPPANKRLDMEMYIAEHGLILDVKVSGRQVKALIPYANIAGLVYGEEVNTEEPAAEKAPAAKKVINTVAA